MGKELVFLFGCQNNSPTFKFVRVPMNHYAITIINADIGQTVTANVPYKFGNNVGESEWIFGIKKRISFFNWFHFLSLTYKISSKIKK